jgi:hypothetical protein
VKLAVCFADGVNGGSSTHHESSFPVSPTGDSLFLCALAPLEVSCASYAEGEGIWVSSGDSAGYPHGAGRLFPRCQDSSQNQEPELVAEPCAVLQSKMYIISEAAPGPNALDDNGYIFVFVCDAACAWR